MTTRRKPNHAKTSEPPSVPVAHRRGRSLSSQTLGALPILNRLLQRIRLEEFLHAALPTHDAHTKLSPVKALLVLLRNLLLSREPMYGIGEWAARHAPDQLGLAPDNIQCLNDDRVGRAGFPVCRQRPLAGPRRGHARGQGVRRALARTAQRLDHCLRLRGLCRRLAAAAGSGTPHGRKPTTTEKSWTAYTVSDQPATTAEGSRLVWYHSRRKAEQDAVRRSQRLPC